MHQHGSLPRARRDDLLVETVGEELLLYDQNSHTAHCLNPIAGCVWRHCDGEHDITELARLAGASEHLVADALQELHEKDLLAAEPQIMQSIVPGVSRREAIVRAARYGAAAAAGSMIVSATASTPAMAASLMCCQCYEVNKMPCFCEVNAGIQTPKQCMEFCEKRAAPCNDEGALTGTKCIGQQCK
jgi:hypothetical protein